MTGAALVLWRRKEGSLRPSKAYWAVLTVAAATGVYAYRAQPELGFVGDWDIYHHYLGAKYADELGYDRLYGATIAADADGARLFTTLPRVRDIRTQGYLSVAEILAHRSDYTSRFTDARWKDFCRDLAFFQGRVRKTDWPGMLADRGYHPTPAWDRLAGLLASHVPLESTWGLRALTLPDEIFFLVACVAIARAYGLSTLCLFLIAWGANPLHMTPLKGAFGRIDWLAALLGSMAAYRRRRYALSGACLGWATMTRVFPVVFVGGVLARAAWTLFETRRPDRRDLRFFAAFAVVAGALFAIGCPLSRWAEFAAAIRLHADVLSFQRSGLEYLVGLGRPWLYWPSASILAAFVALAARRMSRPRLLPAGVALMFTFISAASYYHVVLSALVLCFHRRKSDVDTWGLAALMATFAVGAGAAIAMGGALHAEVSYLWSMMLLGLSLIVVLPARSS
ncbi:MAG: hypothetical protein U0441_22820 [Polyangiaceae bacterium]